ncbi:MAG: sigma-70 family RNA polymerase sigma factor [Christensenella sp.]
MEDIKKLEQLLLSCAKDISALGELYGIMYRDVFACSYAVLQNRELTLDAVNETFVRIYDVSSKYKGGYPRAFILKVCRNVSMEIMRGASKIISDEDICETAAPQDDTFEAREGMKQILNHLSKGEREVIVLHYYNDLRLIDISRVLGIPLGTVKWRHSSALKRCAELCKGEY